MNRFLDSFDHYVSADIVKKWTVTINAGASITDQVTSFGRNGKGLYLSQGLVSNGGVSKTIDYQTKWTVGWAFYNVSTANTPFLPIYQLVANNVEIVNITTLSDSTFSLQSQGISFADTAFSFNANTWYYLEFQCDMSVSTTVVVFNYEFRVNGNTLLTGTHTTTIPIVNLIPGAGKANRHIFSSSGSLSGSIIDDLYINDGQGAHNNSFMGDIKLGVLVANGDNTVAWTVFPPSPTTHFTKINEIPEDGDSTFIESSTVGQVDLFDWQDIASFVGTVPAVQICYYAKKTDEGYRAFTSIVGAYTDPNNSYVNDDYKYYMYNYDQNPDAGADWSVANFNAETFGIEVTV